MAVSFVDALLDPARTRRIQPFGLEIDYDLRRPLDPAEARQLRDLFYRETLLVFRDQSLTMEDQIRVVDHVEPFLPQFGTGYLFPEDKVVGSKRLDYHSDMSAMPMPMDVLSLFAVELDEAGGSWTGFVSGRRAYQLLAEDQRRRIDDLRVTFLQTPADKSQLTFDFGADTYSLTRPCVIDHRITGERLIYVNESATARVEGLGRDESRTALDEVFTALYSPANEFRHVWREGDFLIWDNIALQHCRPELPAGYRRRMQRVGTGRKTLREQNPTYTESAFFGDE